MAALGGTDLRPAHHPLSSAAAPLSEPPFDGFGGDSLVIDGLRPSRWIGWRRRLLAAMALLGCIALFMLAQRLADLHDIEASWRVNAHGQTELASTRVKRLVPHIGSVLESVAGSGSTIAMPPARVLHPPGRWIPGDLDRERHLAVHSELAAAASGDTVVLTFADGEPVRVELHPQGFGGLGGVFWVLSAFALGLYVVSLSVALAGPSLRNVLYLGMCLCQSANLVVMAVESTGDLALPQFLPRVDLPLRTALDLFTASAIVSAACVHPKRLPGGGWIAGVTWLAVLTLSWLELDGALPNAWWWSQGSIAALGSLTVVLFGWSYRLEPHPFANSLRTFGAVTVATWLAMTAAVAGAPHLPAGLGVYIPSLGPVCWYAGFAALLLLVPFMSKSQQVMREFAMFAAISTAATSLDLLFVAVFSLGQFASLTLALFVSLALYAGARQWIVNQLLGNSMLTTERMFEHLYRVAREVELRPEAATALLTKLLRDLFEPLEVTLIDRATPHVRICAGGSGLLLPAPPSGLHRGEGDEAPRTILLRFAARGQRLFSSDDARLAERIVEQLRRAVAFDKAVEQGRSEERTRLAQDLHDDIGARLLTLMYKAQSPEMEEYVRHTLQDLKTLTRGLAASEHRLSHAAAEWKADLGQRMSAADLELDWTCTYDDDTLLNVVQWSALTRVLRELVNNVISHAQARRVTIGLHLQNDRLDLSVRDDGVGRDPRSWSHGLGLGGVRKRVKQLGGEVTWNECAPRGIHCAVVVWRLSGR